MKDRYGDECKIVPVDGHFDMTKAALALLQSKNCGDLTVGDLGAAICNAIAAAPKFEAVAIDDAVAKRVERAFGRAVIESENGANGRDMIAAVRAELGAALGLVEMREPTPEECEEISRLWYRFEHSSGQSRGREMVDIVRAVMRPKGGEG